MGVAVQVLQSMVNAAWSAPQQLSSALSRINPVPVKASTLANPSKEWLLGVGAAPTAAGIPITADNAETVTAVYRSVNILSASMAAMPMVVYERNADGSVQPQPNHPAQRVLNVPNEAINEFQFEEMSQERRWKRGNALAIIDRFQNFRPRQFIPVPPDCVRKVYWEGGRRKYEIQIPSTDGDDLNQGSVVTLDQDFVLHIAGPGFNGLWSPSPITYGRDGIGLAKAGEVYQSRYLTSGGRPSGVLEFPNGVGAQDREEVKKSWADVYNGLENAGKTATLFGGVQFKPVSFKHEEVELLATRRFQVAEVSRIFGVPLFLLNETEKSTAWGSGLEELSTSFVRFTLMPEATRIAAEYNRKLFRTDEYGRFFVRVEMDALMRGTSKDRAAFIETMVQKAAIMTPNEARRVEGMPPVDGGDELRQPTGAPPQNTEGSQP